MAIEEAKIGRTVCNGEAPCLNFDWELLVINQYQLALVMKDIEAKIMLLEG